LSVGEQIALFNDLGWGLPVCRRWHSIALRKL